MLVKKEFAQSAILDAPLNAVWEIISRGSGVDQWLPFITSCRLEGEGENAKRYCETADGKSLSETIFRIDHANHEFEYSIDKQNMMPLEQYKGKYVLSSTSDGKTEITWSSTFYIAEADFPTIAENMKGLYQMGFEGMEKLANQG